MKIKILAVFLSFTVLFGLFAAFPSLMTEAAADGVGYYRIKTSEGDLRIRESPGTGSKQVGQIPSGTVVYVTEISDNWGKTSYKDTTGWISLDYAVKTEETTGGFASTSAASILARLDELRKKFPNGKYWNHYGSSVKDPDGWTNTPCPSGHYLNGVQQCNGQCDGFARKLGLDLFGESTYSDAWETTSFNINTLCVGDIFRYNGKHTVMIVGFYEDTNKLIIADCNWDYHCVIRWDASFSISRYVSSVNFVRHYKGNNFTRNVYLGKEVESVTLDHAAATLPVGASLVLNAKLTPNYPGIPVTWKSSDTGIVKVDSSGRVTGAAVGTATVTATASGHSASCRVTVTEKTDFERVYGSDRVATSVAAAVKGWGVSGAENLILANGFSFADALAGVPLSKALDAPILLTANGTYLEKAVADQIVALGVKNIYILGGTGVVSQTFEDALRSGNRNVVRLAGDTRFDTAVKIAEKVVDLKGANGTVYFANGYSFPDALSAGPAAAIEGSPILYTLKTGELDTATSAFLGNNHCTAARLIGGTGVISENIVPNLSKYGVNSATRLAGDDRFATCLAVVKASSADFSGTEFAVATGYAFPDALAGGALAAKLGVPLILAGTTPISADMGSWVKARNAQHIYVFGGSGAVSDWSMYQFAA